MLHKTWYIMSTWHYKGFHCSSSFIISDQHIKRMYIWSCSKCISCQVLQYAFYKDMFLDYPLATNINRFCRKHEMLECAKGRNAYMLLNLCKWFNKFVISMRVYSTLRRSLLIFRIRYSNLSQMLKILLQLHLRFLPSHVLLFKASIMEQSNMVINCVCGKCLLCLMSIIWKVALTHVFSLGKSMNTSKSISCHHLKSFYVRMIWCKWLVRKRIRFILWRSIQVCVQAVGKPLFITLSKTRNPLKITHHCYIHKNIIHAFAVYLESIFLKNTVEGHSLGSFPNFYCEKFTDRYTLSDASLAIFHFRSSRLKRWCYYEFIEFLSMQKTCRKRSCKTKKISLSYSKRESRKIFEPGCSLSFSRISCL